MDQVSPAFPPRDKLSSMSTSMLSSRAAEGKKREQVMLVFNFVIIVAYILGGAFFFHYFESWSFADSVYFCVVSMSTVGFGDMNASKPHTKLFNAAYILFGVTLIYTRLTAALSSAQQTGMQRMQLTLASIDGEDDDRLHKPARARGKCLGSAFSTVRFYLVNLSVWLTFFVVVQVGCALPYTLLPLDVSLHAATTAAAGGAPTISNDAITNASNPDASTSAGLTLTNATADTYNFFNGVPGGVSFAESLYFSWIVTTTVGCVLLRPRNYEWPALLRPLRPICAPPSALMRSPHALASRTRLTHSPHALPTPHRYGATPDGAPSDAALLPPWYHPYLTCQILLT